MLYWLEVYHVAHNVGDAVFASHQEKCVVCNVLLYIVAMHNSHYLYSIKNV